MSRGETQKLEEKGKEEMRSARALDENEKLFDDSRIGLPDGSLDRNDHVVISVLNVLDDERLAEKTGHRRREDEAGDFLLSERFDLRKR